jgi:hypothetical protein
MEFQELKTPLRTMYHQVNNKIIRDIVKYAIVNLSQMQYLFLVVIMLHVLNVLRDVNAALFAECLMRI